jgi:VWFA-related protein
MIQGSLHRGPATTHARSFRPVTSLSFSIAIALFALSSPLSAQQSATPSSQSPVYTLHGSTRIVLTDVTVKDRAGHMVHGLPASAFQILDNNQPQTISTFEEHNGAPTAIAAQPVSAPNTYSNENLQHLPPVLNIVVLDTASLGLTDQMYLAYEFNRFLKTLPPDLPLAIYARVGEGTVLVQDFTADRKLLLAASQKVMPHLAPAGVWYGNQADPDSLLRTIANELAQIPGHKNVLLFSAGMAVNFDPRAGPEAFTTPGETDLRLTFDLLEKARISVFTIDPRGLMYHSNIGVDYQHMTMEDIAQGTGGQAYFNQNALTKITNDILAADNSFYTLVFSPKNFIADNKWHQIKVTVEGRPYQLFYRHGYYADGFNMKTPDEDKPRTLLLSGGKTRDLPANLHTSPIIFSANIVPSGTPNPEPGKEFYALQDYTPPQKHARAYTIRYSIPANVFTSRTVDGRQNANFDIAVLAFNQAGRKVSSKGNHVSVTFPSKDRDAPIQLAQDINLAKGDLYLYIAVWDVSNGRTGTLQIPFTAK